MHSNKNYFIPFLFLVFVTLNIVAVGCYNKVELPNNNSSNQEIFIDTLEINPPQNFKLIALGDSYTIGQSVCTSCRFPEQLKDSLIVNFEDQDSFSLQIIAQTGWTTSNLLYAIESTSPAQNHDLVTLLIGVNNQYQNKPFSIYENEFIDLVNKAISLVGNDASRLIVISIPDYSYTPFGGNSAGGYISEQLDVYNNYAQQYCDANGLNYVYITDITRQGIENPDLVAIDNLHPSTLAYSKFVERILPIAIEKLQQD